MGFTWSSFFNQRDVRETKVASGAPTALTNVATDFDIAETSPPNGFVMAEINITPTKDTERVLLLWNFEILNSGSETLRAGLYQDDVLITGTNSIAIPNITASSNANVAGHYLATPASVATVNYKLKITAIAGSPNLGLVRLTGMAL